MAGNIIVSLLTGFDDKGIKNAEKALESLKGRLSSFAKTAAVSAGSYIIGKNAVGFVEKSVSAAADLQQAMSGVKTIFGDMQPQIDTFIKSGTSMGMSMAETAKAVTFLGSVFKQTGMPMQNVIDHTEQMTKLAADLAATYGYSVEEALTAMTATFRGEYDPIEKFGVAMKQQQVNAELAARGLKGLTGSALIAAQQQIRYEMILQRTTDAQGAFGRQSGNLAVQQAVLKAEWTDLQAQLGNKLIPTLVQMVEKVKPMIDKLMPALLAIFDTILSSLNALMPVIPAFSDAVVATFTAMSAVLKATSPMMIEFLKALVQNLPLATVAFATFKTTLFVTQNYEKIVYAIWAIDYALKAATVSAGGASKAFAILNIAMTANPAFLMAAGVTAVVTGLVAIAIQSANAAEKLNKFEAKVTHLNNVLKNHGQKYVELQSISDNAIQAGRYAGLYEARAWESAYDKLKKYEAEWQAQQFATSNGQRRSMSAQEKFGMSWSDYVASKNTGGTGGAAAAAAKVAKTWFQTLQDEIKKQAAKIKLEGLGLSDALISSLLSASDWQTAVAKVVGMTKTQLQKLMADFDKTAAGVQDLTDRTTKFVDAVKARIDTIKSLTGSLGDFMPKTLAEVNRQVGQFEGDVVSAADTLKSSLQSALDNKSITQAAYNNLTAYANREIAVLQRVAAQRDALVAKIEAAKSTYLEVANAVRSYGNITSTSTQQITESYVKWIDGVEVTVSRTVDALKNTDLVQTYQDVVNKTKQFVLNLSSLKKMGLNSTLFKQIVDAGVDAGGATAAAIVAGGQDTVSSMNDLFGQLDVAGQQMADMTAEVMANNGVTIVSGFIDGLVSQEQALAEQATRMAQIFSDAFSNNVKFSIPTVNPADYGLTAKQAADALNKAGLPSDQGGTGSNEFGTTIIPPVIPPIVQAVTTIADGLDRVERAAQGIGALASVNTSAVTGAGANAGWSLASTSSAATSVGQQAPVYNVTVNAGLGTDGSSVGQTIVQMLKQYERNNGAVWVSA